MFSVKLSRCLWSIWQGHGHGQSLHFSPEARGRARSFPDLGETFAVLTLVAEDGEDEEEEFRNFMAAAAPRPRGYKLIRVGCLDMLK